MNGVQINNVETSRSIRNVEVSGRRTSFRLEEPFWSAVRDCAEEVGMTVNQLVTYAVNGQAGKGLSMSSAVRVFLICYYRDQALARVSEEAA